MLLGFSKMRGNLLLCALLGAALGGCSDFSAILPPTGAVAQIAPTTPTPTGDSNVLSDPNTITPTTGTGVPNLPYLSAYQGQLVLNGNTFALHGVSWYGFNGNDTMVEGNWQQNGLSGDFATNVQRLAALGFNTVRLPFTFAVFPNAPASIFVSPCTLPDAATLAQSVTPPNAAAVTVSPLPAPPLRTPDVCNDYVIAATGEARLLWTVNFLVANGFYVMIDDHGRDENLALVDEQKWLADWTALAGSLAQNPNTANHILIEPISDPNVLGLMWNPGNSGAPSATKLYLDAMDAIASSLPHALFYIEGASQPWLAMPQGQGFATSPSVLPSEKYDASVFFTQLLTRSYSNRVVMAASAFGPTTTGNPNAASGTALFAQLSSGLGYLNAKGYCSSAGVCTRFPVMVDALGSNFSDANDTRAMQDLASYMTMTGAGNDGLHNPINSWTYWAWNPTGVPSGLVQSDWSTLNWNKITYLNGIGLPQAP